MRDEKPTSIRFSQQERDHSQTVEVYRCQVPLEELEGTERGDVKFCGHCAKNVYRVQNINGFFDMVAAGQCVWVEPQDYLNSGCAPLMGSPQNPIYEFLFNSVEMLSLKQTLVSSLLSEDVCLVGDLVQLTEDDLLKNSKFGCESVEAIKEALGSHYLALGMELENWRQDKQHRQKG